MLESCVPIYLWPEAIATTNHLINRLPTKTLHCETPLDTLKTHQKIPSSHSLPLRIFGCTVYVHCLKRTRNKLESHAINCVFVGYGVNQKGYRCFDPITNRIYTTVDCDFFENEFYYDHLRCQGESEYENLSWLTSPTSPLVPNCLDPQEKVGNATETPSPRNQIYQIFHLPQILSEHHAAERVIHLRSDHITNFKSNISDKFTN